jgi:hypothetical protein
MIFGQDKYLTKYIPDLSSLYLLSWNNHFLKRENDLKGKIIDKKTPSRKSWRNHSRDEVRS